MEQKRRVIDQRNKEKFQVDDAYLNGYARLCGIYATGVYMVLCRHADKDQYCFPSVQTMAEKLAISRDSVMRGIKTLEQWNVIKLQRVRTAKGTWLNNAYVLLDKSEWKPKPSQVAHSNMAIQVDVSGTPSRSQRL